MPLLIIERLLGEDCASCVVGTVHLNLKRSGIIGDARIGADVTAPFSESCTSQGAPSFLTKKTRDAISNLEDLIHPNSRFSWMKASSSFCSEGDRGYTLQPEDFSPGTSSIVWSR